jgi:hypothetical protein
MQIVLMVILDVRIGIMSQLWFSHLCHLAAGKPSFEELTRSSLFPLALQDRRPPNNMGRAFQNGG